MRRYALLIIPPKKINDYVVFLRKKIEQRSTSGFPPHITIYPPFFIKQGISEKILINKLRSNIPKTASIMVNFRSVGYFEGKKNNVVFLKPDRRSAIFFGKLLKETIDSLLSLKTPKHPVSFIKYLAAKIYNLPISLIEYYFREDFYTPEKYTPHLTIAEKFSTETLKAIKVQLRDAKVDFSFKAASVDVYRNEKYGIWKKLTEIHLKK